MALDQVDVDKLGEEPVEAEMSFLDHLEELRWHIMRAVGSVVFFAIITFLSKTFVFQTVLFGPKKPDFLFYRVVCSFSNAIGLGDRMCMQPPKFDFITVEFGEQFITHLKVSLVLGVAISMPYIFWEVWRFIKPGLLSEEKKSARGFVFISSGLFLTGVLFGYYIIAPFAINFLAGYEIENVQSTSSLASYVNYLTMFTIPTGLVFQLPIVVYFLSKIGLVTPEFMRSYRRHAFIIILILAAAITPPDIITQMLIGVPLYFLYEISIVISKRVTAKREAEMK
ncbi:MAG: sec-independent protein translocase protein TatC [Polaribacter sp.]|jgi:sec-independent protein translocase protein TatC